MLNSSTLKSSHDAEVQSSGLEGRLLVLPQDGQDNIEKRWAAFRDALYYTVFEKLWLATRRNQDWFPIDETDDDIQAMLSEKHSEQNGPTSQARTDAFAKAKQKAQKKLLVV